ncbi:hypothetical protein PvtlMGM1_1606 [Prevotella sp. MGM1]|nr:hypothetical protein PvtlMGM1_1606 [Prevotella sp. MGM1]
MPGSYLLTTSINVSPRDKNNTCSVIGCKITKKNPNNQEKYRKRVFITLLHSVEYQLFKGKSAFLFTLADNPKRTVYAHYRRMKTPDF